MERTLMQKVRRAMGVAGLKLFVSALPAEPVVPPVKAKGGKKGKRVKKPPVKGGRDVV